MDHSIQVAVKYNCGVTKRTERRYNRLAPNQIIYYFVPGQNLQGVGPGIAVDFERDYRLQFVQPFVGVFLSSELWVVYREMPSFPGPPEIISLKGTVCLLKSVFQSLVEGNARASSISCLKFGSWSMGKVFSEVTFACSSGSSMEDGVSEEALALGVPLAYLTLPATPGPLF